MNFPPQFGQNYFREIAELSQQFACSDVHGTSIGFDAGIEEFARLSVACRDRGGKVYFFGNGGSSGIASHMAADFTKNGRIPGLTFTDNSLLTCISNDLGYENVFSEPFSIIGRPEDMVVAVSSSGKSANILNGVQTALKMGCEAVSLSGFEPGNPLRGMGDLRFYVPSKSYGYVEILHQAIIHCALDLIMASAE